jgi:hypothetical protein
MRRLEVISRLSDFGGRALIGAGNVLKRFRHDGRDDEIAPLRLKVAEVSADNKRLKVQVARKRSLRISASVLAILASAISVYSCSQQTTLSNLTPAQNNGVNSTVATEGCGSRGGPGYRLANGKCASWGDEAKPSAHPRTSESTVSSPTPETSSGRRGCGSRGGPGYRLSNGKCASWHRIRQ